MRFLIILLIIILGVLAILYFVVGKYFYNIALNPNTSKSYVLGEIDKKKSERNKSMGYSCSWLLW